VVVVAAGEDHVTVGMMEQGGVTHAGDGGSSGDDTAASVIAVPATHENNTTAVMLRTSLTLGRFVGAHVVLALQAFVRSTPLVAR